MDINLENYIKNFKKNNRFLSEFLKKEDEWFYFLCFANICFEGNYIWAKENWEENLIKNNDLCNIIFEDSNNEIWYFIKFLDQELIKESKLDILNNSSELETILENHKKKIFFNKDFKNKIDDFNISEFKENKKIIYLCNFFEKSEIEYLKLNFKEIHKNIEFEIFSKKELLNLVYEKKSVPRFELMYTSFFKNEREKDSKISYFNQEVQGIVCNVNAKSYFSLYNSYKNLLFSNNVRDYFKSKEDTAIKNTIVKDPENFWFYNNGITILCEDFKIDDDSNKIILTNFTIINGAQTVSLIGNNYNFKSNPKMYVLTKIIKYLPKNSFNSDINELFTERIILFTNSQKPIKPRDLKSNKIEMVSLQKELAEKYDIILNIKRGDIYNIKPRPANNNLNYFWQYISNEIYGQLFLAMLLQQPQKSIQLKSKIFSQNSIYESIFNQKKFQLNTSKVIIYNYYQIQIIIRDIINTINNENKEDIGKKLKMWIYAYVTLLSLYSNSKYSEYNGGKFFELLKENNFEIQDSEVKEIKNNLNAENNLKYFIRIFINEAEQVWEEYKENVRNKKSKNLSSFSYNHEQYLKLIENIFFKYFNENYIHNKEKIKEIFNS